MLGSLEREAQRAQRGEDRRQLVALVGGQALEGVGVERLEVGVEGVDDQAERQLALELGGAALEHEAAARLGASNQLAQQVGLADPRLAAEDDEPRRPRARLVEQPGEERRLGVAPHEPLGRVGHVPSGSEAPP